MENVNQIGVFKDIKPEIYTVDELSAVLLNIKENYEEEGRGFPKEIRLIISTSEWLSIIRSSKHDETISLSFNPNSSNSVCIRYIDFHFPFSVNIENDVFRKDF